MSAPMVRRAREWLVSDRPLLTWAPLWDGKALTRHAWRLVTRTVPRATPERTLCGVEVEPPTDFMDRSSTPDCEGCRDGAAAPLAALLAAERALALQEEEAVIREVLPGHWTAIERLRAIAKAPPGEAP